MAALLARSATGLNQQEEQPTNRSPSLTSELPGLHGAPEKSFSLGHQNSVPSPFLFAHRSSARYPRCLAFMKRRRNCTAVLLSISEHDSCSRPYATQTSNVLVAVTTCFITSSHLPHMVKAGKVHFSCRNLKSKSFSFPQAVLQTDTTSPRPEAKATPGSRDLTHR